MSSELADSRIRVMAVSMLTSSTLGRDSSRDEHIGGKGWRGMREREGERIKTYNTAPILNGPLLPPLLVFGTVQGQTALTKAAWEIFVKWP